MAFQDTVGYLQAQLPEAGALLCERFVTRAWEKLRDEKDNWSFLVRKTRIQVNDAISTGSVTVTKGDATVTADATAKALLDTQDAANPSTGWLGWTFRVGAGPVYRISSYDSGTGVITLSQAYFETSGSGLAFTVNQTYIIAPSAFRQWISVVDPYEDFGLNIYTTTQELDEIDPQRAAVDTPWALAPAMFEESSAYAGPLYELYPHAASSRSYPALYRIKDYNWVGGIALPSSIPESLIEDMALVEAYEWAEANRERHKGLAGADWRFLINSKASVIKDAKRKAFLNDSDLLLSTFGENYLNPKVRASGAHYLQAHAPYHPR